jgi:hypothetical protein
MTACANHAWPGRRMRRAIVLLLHANLHDKPQPSRWLSISSPSLSHQSRPAASTVGTPGDLFGIPSIRAPLNDLHGRGEPLLSIRPFGDPSFPSGGVPGVVLSPSWELRHRSLAQSGCVHIA